MFKSYRPYKHAKRRDQFIMGIINLPIIHCCSVSMSFKFISFERIFFILLECGAVGSSIYQFHSVLMRESPISI